MFRLPDAEAIINRLGFNNHGVDQFLINVMRAALRPAGADAGILGLNIGKNFDTPNHLARRTITVTVPAGRVPARATSPVNISSPNTQGLRELQEDAALRASSGDAQGRADAAGAERIGKYTPLVVKIAPDLTPGRDLQRDRGAADAHTRSTA